MNGHASETEINGVENDGKKREERQDSISAKDHTPPPKSTKPKTDSLTESVNGLVEKVKTIL